MKISSWPNKYLRFFVLESLLKNRPHSLTSQESLHFLFLLSGILFPSLPSSRATTVCRPVDWVWGPLIYFVFDNRIALDHMLTEKGGVWHQHGSAEVRTSYPPLWANWRLVCKSIFINTTRAQVHIWRNFLIRFNHSFLYNACLYCFEALYGLFFPVLKKFYLH